MGFLRLVMRSCQNSRTAAVASRPANKSHTLRNPFAGDEVPKRRKEKGLVLGSSFICRDFPGR